MKPRREIVEAGAGCGKTTRLVARYIEAIKTYSPAKVLAVTFSKEAASQMRSRIEKALIEQGQIDLSQRVKSEAQISTFHSLCFKLLEPHFENRGLSRKLKSSAEVKFLRKSFVLSKLPKVTENQGSLFNDLLSALSLQSFLETCHQFWNSPNRSSETSNLISINNLAEKEFHLLNARFQDFLKETRSQLSQVLAEFPDCLNDEGWVGQVALFLRDPFLPPREGGADPTLFKFTKLQKVKKAFPDFALKAYQIKAAIESQVLESLNPSSLNYELDLHGKISKVIEALKKEEEIRLLDFEIIEKEWLEIFSQNSDEKVRDLMGPAPRVLLVDEFQDTNPAQFKILEKLSDSKTEWFFVGDPKQSIYFFRGADVSLFLESKKTLTPLALNTNYRSDPGLLEFFNRVQSEIFTLSQRFFTSGERFIFDPPPQNLEPKPGTRDKYEFPVEVFEFENPRKGQSAVNSDLYPDIFANIQKNQLLLGPESTHAVLFQSWSELYSFADYLRQRGLPHGISGADNVLDHPLTELFVEFVQLLVDKTDSYARNILSRWLDGPLESHQKTSDFLNEFLKKNEFLTQAGNLSIEILGAFCELMIPGRFQNGGLWCATVEEFLKSWDQAMPAEYYPLSERLRMLKSTYFKFESKIELVESVQRQYPLTLLTVHGSKGLEFDAVYLAQMGPSSRLGSKSLITDAGGGAESDNSEEASPEESFSKKIGFQIRDSQTGDTRPGLLYQFDKSLNQTRLEAEKRRLFYVAFTRAAHKLSCFYFRPLKSLFDRWDTENQKHSKALLGCPTPFSTPWNFIMDYLKSENLLAKINDTSPKLLWHSGIFPSPEVSTDLITAGPVVFPKRSLFYEKMKKRENSPLAKAEFLRTSVTRRLNSSYEGPPVPQKPGGGGEFKFNDNDLNFTRLGLDLHALIEIWSGENIEKLFESSPFVAPMTDFYKMTLQKGLREISNLPALKDFWLDIKHNPDRVLREWPLEIAQEEYHLNGIVDALWKKNSTEWILIDWKTARRIENLLSADRINKIKTQLEIYSDALKTVAGEHINISRLAVAMAWGPEPKAEVLFWDKNNN